MSDDIVTRLEQEHWCDADNCNLAQLAADEIERLRKLLDAVLERENKDNKRQLEIVRRLEADRDMWRNALLHGVANLDNQCEGCEICEFIKSKHEEVGGMR